jgi:RNA polymerase sigma factor (sigma-70 family)
LNVAERVGPATAVDDRGRIAARALRVAKPIALGVLGDREAAADVAQEVAITAVRKASGLRDPAALDAWLHRVAVRAAVREAKRARARRAAELAHHQSTNGRRPDDALDGALALLAGLPPRQRAAMTLRYVHDLTDEAIGRALGCRPGTVRSLLSRGRAALRVHESALEVERSR